MKLTKETIERRIKAGRALLVSAKECNDEEIGLGLQSFRNILDTLDDYVLVQSRLTAAEKEVKRLSRWSDYFAWEREFGKVESSLTTATATIERLEAYIQMVGEYAYTQHGDVKADAHSELYQIATLCRTENVKQALQKPKGGGQCGIT